MSPSSNAPQSAFKRPRRVKPAYDIQVGDVVRIGNSSLRWVVEEFGDLTPGVPYADLRPVAGPGVARATLDRLSVVSKGR